MDVLVTTYNSPRMMVLKGGSPAIHKLGDIGREEDDFIRVYGELGDFYVGNFEEGFGFVDVHFAKSDVRVLTDEEIKTLNTKLFAISGQPMYRIHLDKDGYFVEEKSDDNL